MATKLVLVALLLLLLAGASYATPAAADPPVAGYPDSMASLGDSITQAADVTTFGDHPDYSWATGTQPAVNSLYSRLVAVHPAITGHAFNDSVSGARMTDLNGQATNAVPQGAQLITILLGANDVCTPSEASMTPVATFQAQFETAMQTLTTGLPTARIAVVSIPNVYNLWLILHNNSSAQFIWALGGICQSLLANPTSMAPADVQRRANVQQRNIDFNNVLHDVCATYVHCKFDNYVGYNTTYTPADVSSLDFFHPSIQGQALAAQTGWDNSYDFSDATPPASDSTRAGGLITLTATDAAGVSGIEYKVGAGAYQKYTAPLSTAVSSLLTWRAVDVNGNTEATHTCRINNWSWSAGDSDCDGYSDTTAAGAHAPESAIGTDSASASARTAAIEDEPLPDALPLDFNDDQKVNIFDVSTFSSRFGSQLSPPIGSYSVRWDLNADGKVNIFDVSQFSSLFGKACTP